MPYDLYLNNANDKCSVIFEFGTAYTKLGFSGETGPRAILPTSIKENGIETFINQIEDSDEKKELMIKFLYEIYYRKLLINPKDRKVVIVESILNPSKRRNNIAKVLFEHYEVPSILFAPLHLVSLMSLGLQTGLVIDCGYEESTTIPVYEGYHMLKNWQAKPLGSRCVEKNIEEIIKDQGILIDSKNICTPFSEIKDISSILTRTVLEDIKVRICVVSPANRAKQWHKWCLNEQIKKIDKASVESDVKRPNLVQETIEYYTHNPHYGDICIRLPIEVRELAMEPLFNDDITAQDSSSEQGTLTTMILDVLVGCPIDCRRELANNLVVVGGTGSMPGFRSRLLAELKDVTEVLSEDPTYSHYRKYNQLKGLGFKVHNLPGCPNYAGWLGGAIFGHLECVGVRSVSREVYMERGCILKDWHENDMVIGSTKSGGISDRVGA